MATGDFLDLQTNLAILAGRATAADLDEDLALCKQVINESLLEVYRPVDGRAPEWARRTVGLQFRAPLAISIGLTQGSRLITGYTFPADVAGSVLQIGSNYYRYAGSGSVAEPVLVSGLLVYIAAAVLIEGAGTTIINGSYAPTAYTAGVATTYTSANGSTIVRTYSAPFYTWTIYGPDSTSYYRVENLLEGDSPIDVAYELTNGVADAPTVTDPVTYSLVEPATEATGTYSAILHHCCQPIPTDVSEVVGGIEWQGHGLLSPMTDRETDLGYRSNTRGDYHPDFGAGYYAGFGLRTTGTGHPTGDPRFYYLESDALLDGATVTRRLCIVPMPTQVATIVFRAQVFPTELSADSDRPKIVGDLVTRCLLPIAREKWGVLYKKYTGKNQQFLVREADKARRILTLSARPQKRFSGVARPGLR